jgi:radical SAM superfamily enzyme
MQLAVAQQLNALPIKYVKLHHLYIVTGSVMGVQYQRNPDSFALYTLEAYTDFLCELLPLLRPNLVVQRLFGISDKTYHLAPNWNLPKSAISTHLHNAFVKRGVVQGSRYVA